MAGGVVLVSSPAHEGQGGTATLARAPEVQAVSRCMHMCRCMHVCSRGGAYDVHAFAGYMQGCMRACRLQKCGEKERENKREIRVACARLPEKSVCGLGFGRRHGEMVNGTWRHSAGARARCGRHRHRGRTRNGSSGPSRACALAGAWLTRSFEVIAAWEHLQRGGLCTASLCNMECGSSMGLRRLGAGAGLGRGQLGHGALAHAACMVWHAAVRAVRCRGGASSMVHVHLYSVLVCEGFPTHI